MILDKKSHQSDSVANLYRAAFYLAKGAKSVGLDFLKKSGRKFNNLDLSTKKKRLFWAEKVLDEYTKIKHSLA